MPPKLLRRHISKGVDAAVKNDPVDPGVDKGLVSRRYLIDHSVWARMNLPSVAARVATIQKTDTVMVATPQVLEFGYSGRNPADLAKRRKSSL